jgi:hypothetical protein
MEEADVSCLQLVVNGELPPAGVNPHLLALDSQRGRPLLLSDVQLEEE